MSSYINYNPSPTRVWSRVQNICSTNQNNTNIKNDIVYIPMLKKYVTPAEGQYQLQMFQKGNILQYKKNNSNFTKNQNYSRISKGLSNARKKNYATQSQVYTNPNTSSLKRVNYIDVPYPNQIVGSPNNISGPFQPNVPNPFGCSVEFLQDGGNLVCGTTVNPCTGEVVEQTSSGNLCFPTTCSDVPGSPVDLCWVAGTQTWYPRQRYTMPTSLNKWPEGYKGLVSAVTPEAPVLTSTPYILEESVILTWTAYSNDCLPITSYKIYQNNVLIQTVSYNINSIAVDNLNPLENYSFYVESYSRNIGSKPSNIVNVNLGAIFEANGEYSYYNNGQYSSLVFNYSNNPNQQSFMINYDLPVNIIIVGSGGAGTYCEVDSTSAGGGGGGITFLQNITLTKNIVYNINVGLGGVGTNNPINGQDGSQSSFDNYISYGGTGGIIQGAILGGTGGSINTIYGGGGGAGGGIDNASYEPDPFGGSNSDSQNNGTTNFTDNIGGGNSYYANNNIPINIPFLHIPFLGSNAVIQVGGGGGGGGNNQSTNNLYMAGFAGNGLGGAGGSNININGESANNSIYTGYGGGGGGAGYINHSGSPVIYGKGGNGGNGVVIIYWKIPDPPQPTPPRLTNPLPSPNLSTNHGSQIWPPPQSNNSVGGTQNGGNYVINNILQNNNTLVLPTNIRNHNSITIHNKTGVIMTITSSGIMYNNHYAPHGTNSFLLMNNTTGVFTYLYDSKNVCTIHVFVS